LVKEKGSPLPASATQRRGEDEKGCHSVLLPPYFLPASSPFLSLLFFTFNLPLPEGKVAS